MSYTRVQNNSSVILVRKKHTKRQEKKAIQRRLVLYAVANDEIINRRIITNEELDNFYQSILRNNSCVFSIGRLANLLLNEVYVPSSVLSQTLYIDQYKELEDKYCKQITLLDASCYYCRDNITLALIKAGAIPTFHCDINGYNDKIQQVQKKLLNPSLSQSFIVWVVLNYFKFNIGINNTDDIICECCTSINSQLHLQPCSHRICQPCYWDSFLIRKEFDDMCCPICNSILNCKHETLKLCPSNLDVAELPSENSKNIADRSLNLWLRLPESITESSEYDLGAGRLNKISRSEKLKNKTFQALPMCLLQQKLIGTLREKRCEELHKAALQNNWRRMKIIIDAGVDINCINEYGQTCLFVATCKKNYESMNLLLRCGASEVIRDNAGYLASDVANHFNDKISLSFFENREFSEVYHLYNRISEKEDFYVGNITTLIPQNAGLKGAGSYMIDGSFDETFLMNLEKLFYSLPIAKAEKKSCSNRSYYCDSIGWIKEKIAQVLKDASKSINETNFCSNAFDEMRFLHYEYVGGNLPLHVDLSRREGTISSTHTFILYLQTCGHGGETILYDQLFNCQQVGVELARVQPVRGRLLVFPHVCPHAGNATLEVPKILLRGELY